MGGVDEEIGNRTHHKLTSLRRAFSRKKKVSRRKATLLPSEVRGNYQVGNISQ